MGQRLFNNIDTQQQPSTPPCVATPCHCNFTNEAIEDGSASLPDEAVEKVEVAQESVSKLTKSISSLLNQMREHKGSNDLLDSSFTKLAADLAAMRECYVKLENILLLGKAPDGSTATCQKICGEVCACARNR